MSEAYEYSAEGITVKHSILLAKPAERTLRDEKIAAQLNALLAGINTAERVKRGWNVRTIPYATNELWLKKYNYDSAITGSYIYYVTLDAICKPKVARVTFDAEFQNILNSITIKTQVSGWKIAQVDGAAYTVRPVSELPSSVAGDVGYAPLTIPTDFNSYFDHLYGLASPIHIIHNALQRAVADGFNKRFHTALIGPPGCGKSDICQSLKRALGDEAVLEFDATSTTMAGAQKELAEREELPRVFIMEEIEKIPVDSSAAWMLSVLDLRAEIRKTTARGNILKDTRMVAVATVNDEERFLAMNSGALASRFMNKIHFQRPSRELLERIVLREIRSSKFADEAWAKPTLDYAEEHNISDPREVISIALCGGADLMDGSYQRHLAATRKQGGYEK